MKTTQKNSTNWGLADAEAAARRSFAIQESVGRNSQRASKDANFPKLSSLLGTSSMIAAQTQTLPVEHNLKPLDEEILYLKKRILYPGIFEQESDEDERSKRRPIRAHCREVIIESKDDDCEEQNSHHEITIPKNPSASQQVECKESDIGPSGRVKKPWDLSICPDEDITITEAKVSQNKIEWKHYEDEDLAPNKETTRSVMSICEKLCISEEKIEDIIIGSNTNKDDECVGLSADPKCCTNLENLSPAEIARNIIDPYKIWGIPENVSLSRKQLLELMSRIENHSNNQYICLIFSLPYSHPKFSPYNLKITKYNLVGKRTHYTISRNGFLYIASGNAEFTSINRFKSQMCMYDEIKFIPFFANFRLWKTFCTWKEQIQRRKFKERTSTLVEKLFVTMRPLRLMVLELTKMCEKMIKILFLKLRMGEVYQLENFTELQQKHCELVTAKLRAFEQILCEMTKSACRAALIDQGFTPDNYPEEMDFYIKQLEIPVHNLGRSLDTILDYPGQWLTFSLQSKKKHLCKRLTDFIRLVDFIVQKHYHQILKGSMFFAAFIFHSKFSNVTEEYFLEFGEQVKFLQIQSRIENIYGLPILSEDNSDPIFKIESFWTDTDIQFSPSMIEHIKVIRSTFGNWKQSLLGYSNALIDPIFNPYTQPILNGYVEQKTCGNGPNFEMLLDLDPDLEKVSKMVELVLRHSFKIVNKYAESLSDIRLFHLENQKINLEVLRVETDFENFQTLLQKLTERKAIIEEIEEIKNLGLFLIDNATLKEHANLTIQNCLDVLFEVIPEVTDKSVIDAKEKMQTIIYTLQHEPDTIEEYVIYLLYMEDVDNKVVEVEEDLARIKKLVYLMYQYKIKVDESFEEEEEEVEEIEDYETNEEEKELEDEEILDEIEDKLDDEEEELEDEIVEEIGNLGLDDLEDETNEDFEETEITKSKDSSDMNETNEKLENEIEIQQGENETAEKLDEDEENLELGILTNEDEINEEVEATEEFETNEEVEATEEFETNEEVEATEEFETNEEFEATEEVETNEESEATEEVETNEEFEATEEVETNEEFEATEEVETNEEFEATEEVETNEEFEATEEVETNEEVEATEEFEANEKDDELEIGMEDDDNSELEIGMEEDETIEEDDEELDGEKDETLNVLEILTNDMNEGSDIMDMENEEILKEKEEKTYPEEEELKAMLITVKEVVSEQKDLVPILVEELIEQLDAESQKIFDHLTEMRLVVNALAANAIDPSSDPIAMTSALRESLDILLKENEKAEQINIYQNQLKFDITQFDELQELIEFTTVRYDLWDSVKKFGFRNNSESEDKSNEEESDSPDEEEMSSGSHTDTEESESSGEEEMK